MKNARYRKQIEPQSPPPVVVAGDVCGHAVMDYYIRAHHLLCVNGLQSFVPPWLERRGYGDIQSYVHAGRVLTKAAAARINQEIQEIRAIYDNPAIYDELRRQDKAARAAEKAEFEETERLEMACKRGELYYENGEYLPWQEALPWWVYGLAFDAAAVGGLESFEPKLTPEIIERLEAHARDIWTSCRAAAIPQILKEAAEMALERAIDEAPMEEIPF